MVVRNINILRCSKHQINLLVHFYYKVARNVTEQSAHTQSVLYLLVVIKNDFDNIVSRKTTVNYVYRQLVPT